MEKYICKIQLSFLKSEATKWNVSLKIVWLRCQHCLLLGKPIEDRQRQQQVDKLSMCLRINFMTSIVNMANC